MRSLFLLLAAIAVTALNFGYQSYRNSAGSRSMEFSTFQVGTPLPRFDLRPLSFGGQKAGDDSVPRLGCRILVLFSTACLHCYTAAARDAAQPRSPARLSVLWVTHDDNQAARDFENEVGTGSRVLYGPSAFKALKVNGVPTAFLVNDRGVVSHKWPFFGNENHAELREKC
ncbi:MAG TPA: hypothetical protein VEQ60_31390 [Longimicrobium sp.]|nr:hypothetical protein [Longimicrobium sp.]